MREECGNAWRLAVAEQKDSVGDLVARACRGRLDGKLNRLPGSSLHFDGPHDDDLILAGSEHLPGFGFDLEQTLREIGQLCVEPLPPVAGETRP
jgi:hypothetical protein